MIISGVSRGFPVSETVRLAFEAPIDLATCARCGQIRAQIDESRDKSITPTIKAAARGEAKGPRNPESDHVVIIAAR
jgi:hypothetical protein